MAGISNPFHRCTCSSRNLEIKNKNQGSSNRLWNYYIFGIRCILCKTILEKNRIFCLSYYYFLNPCFCLTAKYDGLSDFLRTISWNWKFCECLQKHNKQIPEIYVCNCLRLWHTTLQSCQFTVINQKNGGWCWDRVLFIWS